MKKVFIINGGQIFGHSGGKFNSTVTNWTKEILTQQGFDIKETNINHDFDALTEVEKYKWADIIVYHFPVWWFQVPYRLKHYIDEVFTAGHNNGIYKSDGRSRKNPAINYGTGGLMHGKKYILTSSWNAPDTAFTLPGEFFDQRSVDDGVLFGFHKMNQFASLQLIGTFHFHDMEKGATQERVDNYEKDYKQYLENLFEKERATALNES